MKSSIIFKVIKNVLNIIIRTFIFIFIFCGILKGADKYFELENDNQVDYQNDYVNELNGAKLSVNYVERDFVDYTILLNDEEIPEKGDKKRILIVGDSFVWGHANRNYNTVFWMRLRYILEQEGYNNVEVYAAGSSGLGTVDEVNLILKNNEIIEKVQPDLIIMSLISNDLVIDNYYDENYVRLFDSGSFINDHYSSWIFKILENNFPFLYEKVMDDLVYVPSNTAAWNEKYGEKYGYGYDYRDQIYWTQKYYDLFETNGIKEIANMDIPVVFYETYVDIFNDNDLKFLDFAKKTCMKYGIKYYDSRDNFLELIRRYDNNDFIQNSADGHPAELLTTFYANEILGFLKKDYSNLLGKKSTTKKNAILEINDWLPNNIDLIKESDNEYSFIYPVDEELLTYPLGIDFIKLNLKYPMKYKTIYISGEGVVDAQIFYNKYMGDKDFIELKHDGLEFYVNNEEIYSLNIHIDQENCDSNTRIYIRFE